MKRLLSSLNFIGKALLLLIILVISWAFINIMNLFKGNATSNSSNQSKLFGINDANADAPSSCTGCTSCGCPHVAYFDGHKFKIENDFLGGKPEYFVVDFAKAKSLRSLNNRLAIPDLLKFSELPQKKDGKLVIQFQENELEESFVDWVKLHHVIHPKISEVFIDSSFEKIWVLDKSSTEKNMGLPQNVLLNGFSEIKDRYGDRQALWELNPRNASILQRGDFVEFTFKGLSAEKEVLLFVKSVFRDWMPGEKKSIHNIWEFIPYAYTGIMGRVTILAISALYLFLGRKGLSGALAFAPFVVGSGSECKSIYFSYKDTSGRWNQAAINKPRAWNYGTEVVTLPKEAVRKDGSLEIRADFTKRHALGFLGVLQNVKEMPFKIEKLEVEQAKSSRSGDVTSALLEKSTENYLHLIPGDMVDVEFRNPQLDPSAREKETYLMQSFGFYSTIRKEYIALAGDWKKRVLEEPKERLESLTPIGEYR